MPSVNPFIANHDGTSVLDPGMAGGRVTEAPLITNIPMPTDNSTNAAGTSESVALHVALLVTTALLGVYLFRASGFRFVVAAGGA